MKKKTQTATIGFEAKLWLAADKLRNNMDAAEYKHVVLGLIFLKYISDKFDEHYQMLVAGQGDYAGADPEDKDEYLAANVFWYPKRHAGPPCKPAPNFPPLAKTSTKPWWLSSATISASKALSTRTTAAPTWTSTAWENLSTSSVPFRWPMKPAAPKMCWAASLSIS